MMNKIKKFSKSNNGKENIFTTLREENRRTQLKNEILDEIKKNPQIIKNMPTQRLEELDKMYDEKLQQNDIRIKELQNKLQRLEQRRWETSV